MTLFGRVLQFDRRLLFGSSVSVCLTYHLFATQLWPDTKGALTGYDCYDWHHDEVSVHYCINLIERYSTIRNQQGIMVGISFYLCRHSTGHVFILFYFVLSRMLHL